MSGLTNDREEKIINEIFRTTVSIRPAATYVAALLTLPTDDAMTGVAELGMGVYARQLLAQDGTDWTDPSAGTQGETDNNSEIDFGNLTGSAERVIGIAIMASISGTTAADYLFWSALATGWQDFTADGDTEAITCTSHGYSDNDRVFVRGLALPTGYLESVEYYVVSSTTDTVQLSLTEGGGAVTISSDAGGQIGASNAQLISDGNQLKIAAGALNIQLN